MYKASQLKKYYCEEKIKQTSLNFVLLTQIYIIKHLITLNRKICYNTENILNHWHVELEPRTNPRI